MDQIQIGKFIAEKRKEQNMTQMQLAEKLGITDRAVSKWETGRSLPDAAIMQELCALLHITVNDLLSGEMVSAESYEENAQRLLLEMARQKEAADKRLLSFEVVIGVISLAFMLAMIGIGIWTMHIQQPKWIFGVLVGVGVLQFVVATMFALRIEQVAGYYECAKCGHRYVPKYLAVFFAPHVGRKRQMKCPHCGQVCWHKKVIGKE